MTDPNDITQASAVVDSAGGPGGIVGAVLGALTVLGGLWRIVFGTRKERVDANERAAEIALRAAEHADERAERADEETASHRRALGTCEEQLAAMRAEIRARDEATAEAFRLLREEVAALHAENATLRREVTDARRLLDGLLRTGSTPPPRYTGSDVLAAMAQGDDHG